MKHQRKAYPMDECLNCSRPLFACRCSVYSRPWKMNRNIYRHRQEFQEQDRRRGSRR